MHFSSNNGLLLLQMKRPLQRLQMLRPAPEQGTALGAWRQQQEQGSQGIARGAWRRQQEQQPTEAASEEKEAEPEAKDS